MVDASNMKHGLAISVKNVSHQYQAQSSGDASLILDDVSLDLASGEFASIIGPSGCGKTTLLNMIAGLLRPTSGTLTIAGDEPQLGDARVAYVFARDALLGWRTALQNAALGLQLIGIGKKERTRLATEALEMFGLANHLHSYPVQLSQGMRQRVALARALSMEPKLLLMDEPFSALDAQTRLIAQDLFLSLWDRIGCTVVLITHDLNEAVSLSDKVVVMKRGPGSKITRVANVALERPRLLSDLQSNDVYHATVQTLWSDLAAEFMEGSDQ